MKFFRFNNSPGSQTFWDHLEVLRWVILRILLVVTVLIIGVFSFKEFVFDKIIFPPASSDFVTYHAMCRMAEILNMPTLCPGDFELKLINFDISGQFMVHLTSSFTIAFVIAIPYVLYELWKFIAPALYDKERKGTSWIFISSSVLFYLGCLVAYYLIFPLSIRFLGTYEVSPLVPNQISLQSYMGTLYILTLSLGIMFELPVLAFLLSQMGVLKRSMLQAGRRFAVVAILVLAAIITPTTDPFTMLIVSAPIYLLYELSILVCKKGD